MTLDANETVVAGTGHLYVAPVGSTAPTNATASPAAAFIDLGYATEDGVDMTPSKTTEAVKAWQSFFRLRTLVTDVDFQIHFKLMQFNYETVKLAFGGGTTTGSSPDYKFVPADPSTLDTRAMIVDVIDGSRIQRYYFPTVLVTDVGAIQFTRTAAAGLELTVAPQLAASSNLFELYVHDAEFSAT